MDLSGKTVEGIALDYNLSHQEATTGGTHHGLGPDRRDLSQGRGAISVATRTASLRTKSAQHLGRNAMTVDSVTTTQTLWLVKKGWSMRRTRPRQGQFRGRRVVQVRGLHCSKRAPRT